MDFHTAVPAFLDELEKMAASHGVASIAKARTGRRPISVANLLKKDSHGKLFKKKADAAGRPQPVLASSDDAGAVRPPKKPGDAPSKEDLGATRREDGKDFAAITPGLGRENTDVGIGAFNSPSERSY